jgi:hypothetical protein
MASATSLKAVLAVVRRERVGGLKKNFFLYLFCHDFRKINGRIKIFEKCTSGVVPHGGRLLLSYPTALRRQGGAGRRQGPAAAVPHDGRVYFLVFHF